MPRIEGTQTGLPINELTKAEAPVTVPGSHLPPLKTSMQEFVVPLSEGRAVFQWPTSLSKEDIDDLKDSLKILERKITRSTTDQEKETSA